MRPSPGTMTQLLTVGNIAYLAMIFGAVTLRVAVAAARFTSDVKASDWRVILYRRPALVRHITAFSKYLEIRSIGAEEDELLTDLADIARRRGIELRICCNCKEQLDKEYDRGVCVFCGRINTESIVCNLK